MLHENKHIIVFSLQALSLLSIQIVEKDQQSNLDFCCGQAFSQFKFYISDKKSDPLVQCQFRR
jgi:hypothetical protein